MSLVKNTVKRIASAIGRRYPELIVRIRYFLRFHRRIDLNEPKDLNEKIQFLSLRTDTTEWSRLTDKYEVRGYVEECGLGHILNKLYAVWDSADYIDFNTLPDSFVLKMTNGSNDAVLVEDKKSTDLDSIRTFFKKETRTTYGLSEGNLHYSRIKPRIIAEQLLHNDQVSGRYSKSLIDYKIWCFNGRAEYIWTCVDRTKKDVKVLTYDRDWTIHKEYSIFSNHYKEGNPVPRPVNLDEMLMQAELLAAPFPVVRVDLYSLNGQTVFGEMTFTSLGGYMNYFTPEFLLKAGSKIAFS